MPSQSLHWWHSDALASLDEIEFAHQSVGGSGRGRRYATQQINHAYAVLVSSHFQRFCRDLHNECANHLVQGVGPADRALMFRTALVRNRTLDMGNVNPGSVGEAFNRFGLTFWKKVIQLQPHWNKIRIRQARLEELNRWRNAIAHQDPGPQNLDLARLTLPRVRRWRNACERLATAFDEVMRVHVAALTGAPPW